MGKIVAVGKRYGMVMTITAEETGGKISILNGGRDRTEDFMRTNMTNIPAIGGTFWPEPMTMLAVWSILQNNYFDALPEIVVTGDIGEIPYEEGVVY